jgi:hypothetical protein
LEVLSLDQSDNFIPNPVNFSPCTDWAERWREALGIYLDHLQAFLAETFAPEAFADLEELTLSTPKTAEVFWELSAGEAGSWVENFAEAVRCTHGQVVIRESGREQNAVWVVIHLRKDIALKVYAKTHDRVRFEVQFTQRGRINDLLKSRAVSGSDSLADKLTALNDIASKKLRDVWDTVMTVARPALTTSAREFEDEFAFMAALNSTVPAGNRTIVLRLLLRSRGIAATPEGGIAPDPICRALVRKGLLVRTQATNRGRFYAVAPRFWAMMDRSRSTSPLTELMRSQSPAPALH